MIKKILLFLSLLTVFFAGSANLVLASTTKCEIQTGVNIAANGQNDCSQTTSPTGFTSLLKTLLGIISMLAGALAVVMVIIGGFRYIVSAGNESAVGEAKKTIVYAIVGLIIVAVSQVMIHFVLNALTQTATPANSSTKTGTP